MSTGPTVEVTKTYATVDITAGGAAVTVDVPETTVSITAPGPQGPAGTGTDGYILQAYDTTDQTAASTTTAYPILLGTVDISDGITVTNNGSSQPTRITFNNDGDYNIQFSIQFQNSSAAEAHANVWFRKNDTDISDSNSQVTVPKKHGADNGSLILAANLIVEAAAGDYVELYWQTESTDVSIQTLPAGTTPTTPVTPGVIVTAMVNRYLEVGPAGPGVATGGTTGQVLTKASSTDYDTTWTTPGMRLIKSQTIGTGVSTVEVTNAFSASWDNYRITISGGAASTYCDLRIKIGTATTAYYTGMSGARWSDGAIQSASRNNSVAFMDWVGSADTRGINLNVDVFGPYLSKQTYASSTFIANNASWFTGSTLVNSNSYTDFTLTTSTGTLTGGTIRIYGYNQ